MWRGRGEPDGKEKQAAAARQIWLRIPDAFVSVYEAMHIQTSKPATVRHKVTSLHIFF